MQRSAHEHKLEAGVSREKVSQQDEHELSKTVPLVHFVYDDVSNPLQPLPLCQHPQQHPIGAEHQ